MTPPLFIDIVGEKRKHTFFQSHPVYCFNHMGVLDVLLYSKKGSGQKQLRAHAAINYKKREISIYFRVRLRHFLGRLLRLGQPRSRTPRLGKARGPNAAARGPTLSLYYNSLWHAHVTAFGSCHFFQTWKINKVHVEKN